MNNPVSSRPSGPARVSASEPEGLQYAIHSGRHLDYGFNNASYLNQQINLHYVTNDCEPRLVDSPPTFIRPPPGAAE
jgi:hypothetical protein